MESAPATIPATSARDLQLSVATTRLVDLDVGGDELPKPRSLGQPNHRREDGARHEVRVIEHGGDVMTDSHPADALLSRLN